VYQSLEYCADTGLDLIDVIIIVTEINLMLFLHQAIMFMTSKWTWFNFVGYWTNACLIR